MLWRKMLSNTKWGIIVEFLPVITPFGAQAQDEFDESKVKRDDLGRLCKKLKEGVSKTETTTKQAEAKNNQTEEEISKEEQKKKAEAEKAIFTPSAELAERFKTEVQAVLADNLIHNFTKIDMGTIPQLYVNLGLPEQNLKIRKLSLRKALGLLTKKNWKKIPNGTTIIYKEGILIIYPL